MNHRHGVSVGAPIRLALVMAALLTRDGAITRADTQTLTDVMRRAHQYVVLYEDWLDYVVHKVERRRGVTVELTDRERRWPLIFLWPKAIRILGRRSEPRSRP